MIVLTLCACLGLWLWWLYLVQKGYNPEPQRIMIGTMWLFAWIGMVQYYFAHQSRLINLREVYRERRPPHQCESHDAYDFLWLDPAEPACIEYKERLTMSIWPNPISVAAEAGVACVDRLGEAIAAFLSHQTLVVQTYVFLSGLGVVGLLLFAWPWLCWLRSLAPRPREYIEGKFRPQRLMTIEEVEKDTRLLVC
jgi:hypothetical protein